MAEGVEAAVECGFCLRKGGDLEKPKVLPCTHGHCLPCLMGFYEVNQMLQCPLLSCGKVFEVPITTLPSLTTALPACVQCDSCNKKGDEQMAVVYCTQCKRKYCTNHLESHDDVLADHDKISIDDYKVKVKKLEVRECDEHKGEPYSLGCKHCLKLICVKCMAGLDQQCTAWGCSHELVSLDELIAALIDENIRAKMLMEEEHLERLFKLTSKYSAEFDDETEQMVESLNKTRAEQLQAINDEYDTLGEELMEKRKTKKTEIEIFLDNEVLKKWTKLRNQRLKIESRLEHAHQVDMVRGYLQLKEEVDKLMEDNTPMLEMVDVVHLKPKGQYRDIEVKVKACERLTIDKVNGVSSQDSGLITPVSVSPVPVLPTGCLIKPVASSNEQTFIFGQPPISIRSSSWMKLQAQPFAVCHYEDELYVGCHNKTVAKIDSAGPHYLDERFIEPSDLVESLAVYNDRIYTLQKDHLAHIIEVFDMDGDHVAEWTLTKDWNSNINSLCVISNQVVVADPSHDRITIYSLTGSVRKRTRCQFLYSDGYVAMCGVNGSSVVISDNKASRVFRLQIWTGQEMWTQTNIDNPQGIACHESGYVFVASYKSDTINILNADTGVKVSTITNHRLRGSMYGLAMQDDTLVVTKCGSRQLLCFSLSGLS